MDNFYGMTDAHLDQMQWEAEQEEVDQEKLDAQKADEAYDNFIGGLE